MRPQHQSDKNTSSIHYSVSAQDFTRANIFVGHSMRFGIATINAGITSDEKWGSSKKGKTQSTADLLTRGWSEMNEDFIIDAFFQEVRGVLEGGNAVLSGTTPRWCFRCQMAAVWVLHIRHPQHP